MRFLAFFGLVILSTLLPWPVLLVLAVVYTLIWNETYELLLLSILVDGYYGVVSFLPYYTLTTVFLLLVVEWVKPRLLLYNGL